MTNEEKKIVVVLQNEVIPVIEKLNKNRKEPIRYSEFLLKGIRDPIAFLEGFCCLETLGEKLYKKHKGFKLGDIDGFLCYRTKFLFVEFKKTPNALKEKQLAAYIQLVKNTNATLIIVFGDNCNPKSFIVISRKYPLGTKLIRTDLNHLQTVIESWGNITLKEFEDEDFNSWKNALTEASKITKRVLKEYKTLKQKNR